MKIIQLPFCFYPDPVGGTEIYVESLCQSLQKQGFDVIIAAPSDQNNSYIYKNLKIERFAISEQVQNLREIYGEGDELGEINFSEILEREKPDLIHLHAFTRGVSLRLVRCAKKRNIPVVFTYHTPTVSCQRGTLLQWGKNICDGKIDLHTCAKCALQSLGLNPISANIIGSIPHQIGDILGDINISGGIFTALRMTELVNYRSTAFTDLMTEVDQIIAVCDWVKNVLRINNVSSEKITVIRQGLCNPSNIEIKKEKKNNEVVKVVFLGRLDPTKGIEILIKTWRSLPKLTATLDIYGISQKGDRYKEYLLKLAENDSRIKFKEPVKADEVVITLAKYDLLAVPSQISETGPMVILEGYAAGIPVIGSNLGGITELVQHNVNGILVEANSISDWGNKLENICQNPQLLEELVRGISPPETMVEVSEKMAEIYRKIGGKRC